MAIDPMLAAYQHAFSTDWYHLAQQKDTKFGRFVTPESFEGESERFTRLGTQKFQKRTSRREKNKVTDPVMDFRHIFNDDYTLVNVLDKIDKRKIGSLTAPESEWTKSHAYAYNRLKDNLILSAALGTAIGGEKPTDNNALPVDTNAPATNRLIKTPSPGPEVGLTEDKLRKAKLLLDKGAHLSMDPGKRVLALDPEDLVSVYNSVAPADTGMRNLVRDVMDGKTSTLCGFEIVQYTEWDTSLPGTTGTSTGSNRRIVGWMMGAIKFNEGGRSTRISELDEQNFDLQLYSSAYLGGVRMEEALVVAIECKIG